MNSEPLTSGTIPARGEESIRTGSQQPGVILERDLRRGFAGSGVPSDWSAPEPEYTPEALTIGEWPSR
jgi:hypothetical protein